MPLAQLLAYLAAHYYINVVAYDYTKITVETVYTRDGVLEVAEETIPANYESVRSWLGY